MSNLKLNHVALSMSPELIEGDNRRKILDFYGDVFEWSEYVEDANFKKSFAAEISALTGKDVAPHEPLVLLTGAGGFVFLYGLEDSLRPSLVDHFGLEVDTEEEFDAILARAKARAALDQDVSIVDKAVTPYEIDESIVDRLPGKHVELVNCYIKYQLPLSVEIQYYRWS